MIELFLFLIQVAKEINALSQKSGMHLSIPFNSVNFSTCILIPIVLCEHGRPPLLGSVPTFSQLSAFCGKEKGKYLSFLVVFPSLWWVQECWNVRIQNRLIPASRTIYFFPCILSSSLPPGQCGGATIWLPWPHMALPR